MGRLLRTGLVVLAALVLAPASLPAMSDPDKPMSSHEIGEMRPVPRRGATGIVRAPDGRPIAGVFIEARSLDEPAKAIPDIAIVTNESGSYVWPLRPGRYRLTPMLDGRRGAPVDVIIGAGRVVTVDLTITP